MRIYAYFKALIIAIASLILSGCLLLNDVEQYTNGQSLKPDSGRSLVVIGLGIEEAAKSQKVHFKLDEYDPKRQKVAGNCWRYNKIDASISVTSDKIQYVVFDVPSGFYAGYEVGLQTLDNKALALLAPSERIVYFGDFIKAGQTFERRINFNGAAAAIKQMHPEYNPGFKGGLVVAETLRISPAIGGVLCTP